MTWSIELSETAQKQLDKLDRQIAKRILKFLFERIAGLEDPRSLGHALEGSDLGAFWRYRTGDYRVICLLEDHRLVIAVIRIGHRREVYR